MYIQTTYVSRLVHLFSNASEFSHHSECNSKYVKFRGSRTIVDRVGLVPFCHRAFVGISWVQNIFSWVFRGFQIFSRRYFVGLRFFVVGISWVQFFFSCVFREPESFSGGFKIFSRGYFVGPNFFLVGNSWARNFFSWV